MTKLGTIGKIFIFSSLAAALSQAAPGAEPRTWTDVTGAKVEAAYVSSTAKAVTLRRANLQNLTVPLNKLSEEDRKLIADLQKEEKAANTLKVNIKGDIVWRVDNQYRSMTLFNEQNGEIWTWDEETKAKKDKIATVKVKYDYQFAYSRNDIDGYYETEEPVEVPKDAKLVVLSKLKLVKDNKPINKEDVSVPMDVPQVDNDVIKLPTARASAR